MRIFLRVTIIAALLPLTSLAQGFRGSVEFTAAEKAAHERHVGSITRTARRYLEDVWRDHLAFHRRWGGGAQVESVAALVKRPSGVG